MTESTEAWPVGLRFRPTEDELVSHHLTKKLFGGTGTICVIPELYIYNWEPPDLFILYNALSRIPSDGHECFFFCPPGRKRKTEHGFWKETSKKRIIRDPETGKPIATKRISVYYEGRQPKGRKTDVAMHEYNLISNVSDREILNPMGLVLCRIINRKSKKTKPAISSTSTDLSGPRHSNDSQNAETQEISAQASPGVTVEFPYPDETGDFNLPDQNVPIPDQQPQTSEEQRLSHDDRRHVDEPSDRHCYMSYSPSNCIDLADLFNFDERNDYYAKLE